MYGEIGFSPVSAEHQPGKYCAVSATRLFNQLLWLALFAAEPEIRVHRIDRELDEFIVMATDGLWDYYTPESTVLTDTRRKLRQCRNDPQHTADWLVSGF